MPLEVNRHCWKPQGPIGMVREGYGYEICLQIFTDIYGSNKSIGTGFTDDKDASRTIRTGFTDRFLVSHDRWVLMERRFLMDESLHKGTWLGFFCIHSPIRCEYINFWNFAAYTVYV